jgi:AcrR family transcriptional regulator
MKAPSRIKPERARRVRSERTELELLRTGTLLFSERGFHGTGIRDIADSAGVAVSAMYYYASSKDELLEAVVSRGLDRLIESARQALEGIEGPSERLARLVGVHVALHARNPRTTVVIDHEFTALPPEAKKAVIAQRDAYEAMWEAVLREGVAAGEFVDRGAIGRLALIEMCTGVAHWFRPRGKLTIPQLCERFADMALSLLGARRSERAVTAAVLAIPPMDDLLRLVDIETEPRRGRARP